MGTDLKLLEIRAEREGERVGGEWSGSPRETEARPVGIIAKIHSLFIVMPSLGAYVYKHRLPELRPVLMPYSAFWSTALLVEPFRAQSSLMSRGLR